MTEPAPAPLCIELRARRGRIALRLRAQRMGEDLCVTLSGGDREHIGAVAVSRPPPGAPRRPAPTTSSDADTSIIALPGHREDALAQRLAGRLAAESGGVVCFACGIHVDAITPEELRDVDAMAEELAAALAGRLAAPDV